MSLYLELPVSIGEAIDKLTILDIKCDKITDNRKVDVEKEYNMLMCKLEKFITKDSIWFVRVNGSSWNCR